MIKYIGSKRTLVPLIADIVRSIPDAHSIIDYFSGTSRVGHALKNAGYRVIANDLLSYAHILATCYVQADREPIENDAIKLLGELAAIEAKPGYFTETFCQRSRFFRPENGARVDAIRERIEELALHPERDRELRAVLLTSLMEAADRVDSTTGLQMAYLKSWAKRAYNPLELRMPKVLPANTHAPCEAHQLEAQAAAATLEADLAYIDPPYNQHTYIGNYHIWESLVLWDKPEVYGVACKRIDCKSRKSDFNSKKRALDAFTSFIHNVRCRFLIVSFNNEGFITREQMESILANRGDVHTIQRDFKRYVGAQIGIYNPSGDKVGRVSHLRNKEYLYVVVPTGYPWSPQHVGADLLFA